MKIFAMRLKYTCVGWAYLDIMHKAIKRMVKIGGMFLMTKKNFVFAASFLTMLVVNAAWADIASTNYADKKVAIAQGSSNVNKIMITDKNGNITPGTIKDSGSGTLVTGVSVADGVLTVTKGSSLPTVNNATLTIQKNGTTVATFAANSDTEATANIIVPTKVSDLENDSSYATTIELDGKQDKSTAVTHTEKTAAGTTTRPVYVTDAGVATAVSGISVPVKEEGNTKSWAEIWVE